MSSGVRDADCATCLRTRSVPCCAAQLALNPVVNSNSIHIDVRKFACTRSDSGLGVVWRRRVDLR